MSACDAALSRPCADLIGDVLKWMLPAVAVVGFGATAGDFLMERLKAPMAGGSSTAAGVRAAPAE